VPAMTSGVGDLGRREGLAFLTSCLPPEILQRPANHGG